MPVAHQPRAFVHTIYDGERNYHDIFIQHHETEPTITIQRMLGGVLDDRLLLCRFEPMIA